MANKTSDSQTQSEPIVEIFGEKISADDRYKDVGNVIWGIMLIYAGLVLFLNSLGIIPWQIWEYILKFWPLLVILAGIHIILGNNFISRLILVVLSILVFGFVTSAAIVNVSPDFSSKLPNEIVNFINYLTGLIR